jgi:lipoyl(octanoyl) transferase
MYVLRLGRVGYESALELQQQLLEARQEGRRPDTLLLLEHPPTFTFGARARPEHLLVPSEELEWRGVSLHPTRRGGDITYHGPGQLVGYPIFALSHQGRDVHRYVRNLEEALIRTLSALGIASGRSPGQTGVWVGDEKIAAIGVEVRRWVARHGFALNVTTDLSHFDWIVPCGIADKGVTSVEKVLGKAPAWRNIEDEIIRQFETVFGLKSVETDPALHGFRV